MDSSQANAIPQSESEVNAVSSGADKSAGVFGWKLSGNPVSDSSTSDDKLGFRPYVDAIAAFLTDRDTAPPLTMSVEGEWGSGKTSFMRQLEGALKKHSQETVRTGGADGVPVGTAKSARNLTFWFNAWRHDKQDAVWAAFALCLTKEIRNKRSLPSRMRGDLRLAYSRLNTVGAKIRMALVLGLWLVLIIATMASVTYTYRLKPAERSLFVSKVQQMVMPVKEVSRSEEEASFWDLAIAKSGAEAWIAALVVVGLGWFWISKHLGKHLELKLEKYLNKPDYDSHTSFIETFHEDFRKLVAAYAENDKIFVFVDDLDRCDIPKAGELMQAINLMIGDNPLIFILGMDREKVAAGITLKYKDLLQFLRTSSSDSALSARHPSSFGYTYLEKFIQITFRVPRPSESGVNEFLENLSRRGEETEEQKLQRRAEQAERAQKRQLVEVMARADSDEVGSLVKLVAPALEWNPRRMKQFINSFRLQAYIASDLGLLDVVEGSTRLTLPQLGKFVAIAMTWPDLVMDMQAYPGILRDIYKIGLKNLGSDHFQDYELVKMWSQEKRLTALLMAGNESDWEAYSLERADLRVLLDISPRENRRAENATSTPTGINFSQSVSSESSSADRSYAESRFSSTPSSKRQSVAQEAPPTRSRGGSTRPTKVAQKK